MVYTPGFYSRSLKIMALQVIAVNDFSFYPDGENKLISLVLQDNQGILNMGLTTLQLLR